MGEITTQQNRVAIRLTPRDMLGSDIGTGTRAIVYDDGGTTQFTRQGFA
jgi:hypothetical protein